jgi:RIO kinase 1
MNRKKTIMPTQPEDFLENYDDFEEMGFLPRIKNMPVEKPPARNRPAEKPKNNRGDQAIANLAAEEDRNELNFTYKASKNEAVWLNDSLRIFYAQRWFDDVLHVIKGGKEASVYQLKGNETTGQAFLAAKVYRPRMFRSLKNDQLYREGRGNLDADGLTIINDGMLKAIRQRTEYGRRLIHTSWIEHEVQAMRMLREAGCDVPAVYASGDNAILMEYIGGPAMAAPTLNTVALAPNEARQLFNRVLTNINCMLEHDRVHGDLSAYNILYWEGEIMLIDFPQAINPHQNRNAYMIFERDVLRVCEYFASQGVPSDPKQIAEDLWMGNHFQLAPEIHPAHLSDEDEKDRELWDRYHNPPD